MVHLLHLVPLVHLVHLAQDGPVTVLLVSEHRGCFSSSAAAASPPDTKLTFHLWRSQSSSLFKSRFTEHHSWSLCFMSDPSANQASALNETWSFNLSLWPSWCQSLSSSSAAVGVSGPGPFSSSLRLCIALTSSSLNTAYVSVTHLSCLIDSQFKLALKTLAEQQQQQLPDELIWKLISCQFTTTIKPKDNLSFNVSRFLQQSIHELI